MAPIRMSKSSHRAPNSSIGLWSLASLMAVLLITDSAFTQRKGSNQKSLRAQFLEAAKDDQKLKQLVDQVVVG